MSNPLCSFASPKVEARLQKTTGRSVFCIRPIQKGEVVVIVGGELLSLQSALNLTADQKSQCLQIEDDHVLWISNYIQSTGDWVNHSCNPNLGLSGQLSFVAMRDIAVDEEVCYDYAMSDGSEIDEFVCGCRAPNCRRKITGQDWKNPILQKKYEGYFSPYLARRIAKFKPSTLAGNDSFQQP